MSPVSLILVASLALLGFHSANTSPLESGMVNGLQTTTSPLESGLANGLPTVEDRGCKSWMQKCSYNKDCCSGSCVGWGFRRNCAAK